jgi:hypothetical protein
MASIKIGAGIVNQPRPCYILFKNRDPLSASQRQQIVECFWQVPDCEDIQDFDAYFL